MSRNTNPDSNGGKIKSFINNLEYIIFGSNSRFLNGLESNKLDMQQVKKMREYQCHQQRQE